MANTASRLITLIMLLQRQPNQTASQLAQALDVSVRTVQRYMTTLDDMGIPINAERGPYGGYALVRGYKMPPLVFTPEETVAIYLGTTFLEQIWGRLYQEAARGALARLGERLSLQWFRQGLASDDPQRVHETIQIIAVEQIVLLWPDLERLAEGDDDDVSHHARESLERLSEELDRRFGL